MKTYKARCVYGYYEKIVEVVVDKRLKYCPYGQCGVRIHVNKDESCEYRLISYQSTILIYKPKIHSLIIDGDKEITAHANCTATTRRHVSAFLKEYIPSLTYHDIKNALKNDEKVVTC